MGSAFVAGLAPHASHAAVLPPPAEPVRGRTVELLLEAAERPVALPCFGGRTLPLWTFSAGTPLPIVRLRLGDRLRTRLVNRLGEHTSIHWHGLRIPIAEDGVPYLSQPPVEPEGVHVYDFEPPDTGSFFFHTHCNTVEQLGRGLAGLLVVEGDELVPPDADLVLAAKDWRVGEEGFLPFLTDKGAGTTGTFGTIRSTNGEISPTLAVPASADVRLRIYNVDSTRILEIGVEGAEAAVIAVDGLAVPPFPLRSWRLGPAMRIDLRVRTPAPGATATVVDYRTAEPYPLAVLAAAGEPVRTAAFDPAPLRAARLATPDLATAERMVFEFASTARASVFEAGPEAFPGIDDLCLSDRTFWSINRTTWPADGHNRLPPPLALLRRGASYRFELVNPSKQFHPIHVHGHSFTVLGSNLRSLPVHHADTVLLAPRERVEVAFVADNPGDWMFHCHLIEHQETGMMGYLRVA